MLLYIVKLRLTKNNLNYKNMKLSDFKKHLTTVTELNFVLPNGTFVPKHVHVTEVGQVTKHFID